MNKWSFRDGLGIEESTMVIDPRRTAMINQKEMQVVYLKT